MRYYGGSFISSKLRMKSYSLMCAIVETTRSASDNSKSYYACLVFEQLADDN